MLVLKQPGSFTFPHKFQGTFTEGVLNGVDNVVSQQSNDLLRNGTSSRLSRALLKHKFIPKVLSVFFNSKVCVGSQSSRESY